jgi:CheY-like chemotaxis protein
MTTPAEPTHTTRELPTVLVIDDEPGVRLSLKSILSDRFTVVACVDGEQAIDYARDHPGRVYAAIVDYAMSGMDGDCVCSELRCLDRTISLVGLSADRDAPFRGPLVARLWKKDASPGHVIATTVAAVQTTEQLRKSWTEFPGR